MQNDSLKTLTLKCPSCGADLQITSDMDRFACGYCGTEQIVRRQGGTVVLRMITSAIAQVQISTDRTAAELAINRLSQELDDMGAALTALNHSKPTDPSEAREVYLWAVSVGIAVCVGINVFAIMNVDYYATGELAFGCIVVTVIPALMTLKGIHSLIGTFQREDYVQKLEIWEEQRNQLEEKRKLWTGRLAHQRTIADS